jgi:hypothetical protein
MNDALGRLGLPSIELQPVQEPRKPTEHIIDFLDRHATLVALDFTFLNGEDPDALMADAGSTPASEAQGDAEGEKRKQLAFELKKRAWQGCKINGIFDLDDIIDLAQNGTLHEVVPRGMAHSILREFERESIVQETAAETALVNRGGGFIVLLGKFLNACVGNESAMTSTCSNYGIIAALVLTMSFANFDIVSTDSLNEYALNVAFVQCIKEQSLMDACGGAFHAHEAQAETTHTCFEALNAWMADQYTNLTACCWPVVECTDGRVTYMEGMHVFCNGTASVVLLLVVLQSAWLFIALQASNVNKQRGKELALLIRYYRRDCLLLQVMFLIGMIMAFFGLGTVATIKTTTTNLAWIAKAHTAFGITLFFLFLFSIIRAVGKLNAKIDNERLRAYEEVLKVKGEAGATNAGRLGAVSSVRPAHRLPSASQS